MEKLQPVLKQIFWILFGLLILLAPFGWWSAQGNLSAEIDTRKTAVEKAFTDAGKNVSAIPNARWTENADKLNVDHEGALKRAAERLREDQLEARVYPKSIRDELNRLRFNSKIDDPALRERFGDLYRSYFWEQLQVIRPFIKGRGLVDISEAQITQENETKWATKPPTSQEIWNAQEDIWLLRSIYDSIAMVNKGVDRMDKAPLRSLLLLQLRGGDPEAEPGAGGGGGGFGGMSSGGYESSEGSFGGGGFGGAGTSGMGAGSGGVWQSFVGDLSSDLLNEEFGAVAGGGGGGMSGGMFGSEGMMGGGGGGGYESSSGDDEEGASGSGKRYVHDDEQMPYRTRAFVLKVKILQQNIPNLLAELTNSKFPVEIVRVDASFGNDPRLSPAGGGAGGRYSSGGGGYEGGMGSGMSSAMSSGLNSTMGGGGGYESSGMGGGGYEGGMSSMGGGGGSSAGGLGSPYGPKGSPPDSRQPLSNAEKKQIAEGNGIFAAAMMDPDLSIVRVAGLMTMYRSQEENEAEAEAEAAAQEESMESSTGVNNPADAGAETETQPPADDASTENPDAPSTDDAVPPTATTPDAGDGTAPGPSATTPPGDASPDTPDAGQPGAGKPAAETESTPDDSGSGTPETTEANNGS